MTEASHSTSQGPTSTADVRKTPPGCRSTRAAILGESFLCRPLVTTHQDSPSHVAHPSGTAKVSEVPNELLALAEMLQSWETFDGHLAAMESAGLALTAGDLAHALGKLDQAGALWFDDEFLKELGRQASRPAAPIGSMVWCTRDRPRNARRAASG